MSAPIVKLRERGHFYGGACMGPALETSDDRIRRYLALLDQHGGTPEDSPEDLYVRLDVAYDALSGQEMERVERIMRGEEPRP